MGTICKRFSIFQKGGFVYNATAVCQFGDHSDLMEKFLKLEGIGNF